MEKAQMLDLIRNRLTLPRTIIQVLTRLHPQCRMAVEEIDALIKEIEREGEHETSDE